MTANFLSTPPDSPDPTPEFKWTLLATVTLLGLIVLMKVWYHG